MTNISTQPNDFPGGISESERVRSEIDDTRDHLGQTVEAIGDKVMPGRIIERQKENTARSLRSLKERVMGSAHDAGDHVSGAVDSTAGLLRHAPQGVAHRTEGSPLAAGGVAFAIGVLAAAVWKPTSRERQLVEKVAEAAPQITDGVAEVGREVAGSMKEQAAGAAEELKSSVVDAVDAVKSSTDGGADSDNVGTSSSF